MTINMVDINSVIPYENNPRNNLKAVDPTAESIRQFGFKQPIVVDKDGIIIIGHTRLLAAKKLGLEKVPVVVADDLTEREAKELRIMDNKTAELAVWDDKRLDIELTRIDEIGGVDMSEFGFEVDMDKEIEKLDTEDEEEPKEKEEKMKYSCPNCGLKFNEGAKE